MSITKIAPNCIFGRWKVLSLYSSGRRTYWNCICECGTKKAIERGSLVSGKSKSCGCLRDEVARGLSLKHGHTSKQGGKSRTYTSWVRMRERCCRKSDHKYPTYGARGIKVCKRWHSFENFLKDMGIRPANKTLDRINNYKGYCRSNCRWATPSEQQYNRRKK